MKLKSMAVAAALALGVASSFATEFSFEGTIGLKYSFDTLAGDSIAASITSSVVQGYGFDITGVTFDGISFTPLLNTGGGDYWTFAASGLTAGEHYIKVTGTPLGSSYTANVVLTPVPEPETYALLLGGLGAIGFMARRRLS
jgi:hypothetical protein